MTEYPIAEFLDEEQFAAAMRLATADPLTAATPGDTPDVVSDDPCALAAEGGGDDPNACADHVEDGP